MFLVIAFANNIRYRSAALVSSFTSSSSPSLLLLSSTHSSSRFHSTIQTHFKQFHSNKSTTTTTTMRSPILPISVPSSQSAAAAATMLLITEEQQQPKARLLSSSSSSSSSLEEEEDHKEKDKRNNKNRFFSRACNLLSSPFGRNKRSKRHSGSGDTNSSDSLPLNQRNESSLTENVEHVASETFFVTRLCLQLLQYLGLGYKWITKFLALGCYSLLIMPGVLQVAYHYYTSKQIKRDIVYGDKPRNRLDLFVPVDSDGLKPVVAFVTGGAWVIGYKAWGAVLGSQLAEKDILVACIDYRNFPQSTIADMVSDASQGISFVCNNIAEYGGDPNRVYVMGQSAGAHISACALVEQASKECKGESTSWSLSQIKAYFGLSGGYNLLDLVDHFHERGLYRSLFLSIMEGDQSLRRFSPELVVQDPSFKNAVSLMPPVVLFHGDADYTIPSDSSKNFVDTLHKVGAQAELVLYEGKTHTDVFVQDALRGGTDVMVNDVTSYILGGDEEVLARIAQTPPRRRLVPEFMLKLARMVSPF